MVLQLYLANLRICINVACLLLFSSHIFCQEVTDSIDYEEGDYIEEDYWDENVSSPSLYINFFEAEIVLDLPQGAFARNHPNAYGGIKIAYLRQLKVNQPLFYGFNLSYFSLDSYSAEVERIFDTFVERWDGSSTSNLLELKAFMRYFFRPIWKLDPYAEFGGGFNCFYTGTTFSFPGGDESDFMIETSDFSFRYGGSLGLLVSISDQWYINASAGYYPSFSSRYYVEKTVKETLYNSTIQAFDLKKSTADVLRFTLGISYIF